MEVSVGIKVAARGLEWDVTEVEALGAQQRVRLACSAGDLTGLEWDLLYPSEALSVLRTEPRPDEAGPLDAWRRYHTARLLEQIPGSAASPGRIAIEAYQRVPLLRALDMVRPRLMLACTLLSWLRGRCIAYAKRSCGVASGRGRVPAGGSSGPSHVGLTGARCCINAL